VSRWLQTELPVENDELLYKDKKGGREEEALFFVYFNVLFSTIPT
jgi:hypothetical protein